MNKKYIVGGVVFWLGMSGYMGLRILESYTEDAVVAALSAVPAQVQEVRFSLLDKSLKLKGVDFEIPDQQVQRKGTIESVEVKNFNRKILFVLPKMPEYDADSLPQVADQITVKGFSEHIHAGYTKMSFDIGSVAIKDWRQRLGLVFDQYSRKGVGEAFYEELFRCRIEELRAEGVKFQIEKPDLNGPLQISMRSLDVPGGIRPPRGMDKVPPFSLTMEDISFSHGKEVGGVARAECRDIRLPDPADIIRLQELSSARKNGMVFSLEKLLEELQSCYKDTAPITSLSFQDARIKTLGSNESTTLKSFSYSSMRKKNSFQDSLNVSQLHLPLYQMGETEKVVQRFSPNGVTVSFDVASEIDAQKSSARAGFSADGLGSMEVQARLSGDFLSLKQEALRGSISGKHPMEMLKDIQIEYAAVRFNDSGMAALLLALAAEESGQDARNILRMAGNEAGRLRMDSHPLVARLGSTMMEQLRRPGECNVEFTPEKAMSIQEATMKFLFQPSSFPLKIASSPGEKGILEYPVLP